MIQKCLSLLLVSAICLPVMAGDKENPKNTSKAKLEPMKIRKRNARPDIPGTLLVELGWNILRDNPSEMEIGTLGSRTFNLYYFYNIELPFASGRFELMPGFGVGLDRYRFEDDITLASNNDVEIVELEDLDVTKSMLVSNYFDVPLELRFYANPNDKKRSFKVGLGFKAGIRFSSHTKVKYEEDGNNVIEKEKNIFGLNRFRYGVTGRIGIGGINFFYYQSLSELFESGEGPLDSAATNVTVGLSFRGF